MVAVGNESLCMEAFRSKYKVIRSGLKRKPVKNASPISQSIKKARELIIKGACYLVGDEKSIDIWLDPWVPWLEGFKPSPKDTTIPIQHMMVSNFIDQHNRQWNVIALAIIFDDISVEAVRKIIRSSLLCQDKFYWIKEHTGTFSVKSSYKISQEHKTIINHGVNWSKLWKLKIHERLKILMWQIESNTIPTKQNLEVRLGSNNSLCPLCNEDVESNANLFFHCQFARAIWFGCCWGLRSL